MVRIVVQSLKILTIGVTAILITVASVGVFRYAVQRATPPEVGKEFEVRIREGDTPDKIGDALVGAGLIRSKLLFTTQMRVTGRGLQPGSYVIRKGMTVEEIIGRITGAVVPGEEELENGADTFDITIPEGWRIEQIAEEYEQLGGEGGARAFVRAIANVDRSRYDFLAELAPNASLEGFLFPDTYTFYRADPDYDVALMLENFGRKFTPEMRDRARAMNLDIRQVLMIASLVEREAQIPSERPTIADIYLSRLELGMNLEADPTVQYAIGKRGGEWWFELSEDDLFVESPYNTYQNGGLPPGPICNPGLAAIQGVLTPAETNFLFFVAKGDGSGEHYFAETKEVQDANIEVVKTEIAER